MNKFFLFAIIFIIVIVGGLYIGYRLYLPGAVADALIKEPPVYLPKVIQHKFDEWKAPANNGAKDILETLDKKNIPIETLINRIDATTEKDIDAFVKEFTSKKINDREQIFELVKKHFSSPEFDIESFREPFIKNVSPQMVRKGIEYYSLNQRTHDIDFQTGKNIIKEILIKKSKEK